MGAVLGAEAAGAGAGACAAGAASASGASGAGWNAGDGAHVVDITDVVDVVDVVNVADVAYVADVEDGADDADGADGADGAYGKNSSDTSSADVAAAISADPNAQESAAVTATERPRTVLLIAVCQYSKHYDSSALWTVMVRDSNGRLAFPSCPQAPDTTARKALAYGMQGIASCGLLLAPYHIYRLTHHFTLDEPERDSRGTTTAVYTAHFLPRNMPAERGDPAAPGSVVILKMADVLMRTDLASDHLMALIMVLGGCNGHEPLPGGIRMLAVKEQHLTAQMKTGFNGGPYPGNQVALDALVSAYGMHFKRHADDDDDVFRA